MMDNLQVSETDGSSGVPPSLKNFGQQLENLKRQYESQLEDLQQELARAKAEHSEDAGSQDAQSLMEQKTEELRRLLNEEQKSSLEQVLTELQSRHEQDMNVIHQQHLDDVDTKVKAMRITLEQIYTSQLQLVKAELEQQRARSLQELRESLTKEHKEEINRVEAEWGQRMQELEDEHDDELNMSLKDNTVGSEASRLAYIEQINQRLSREHQKLIQKIFEDLDKTTSQRKQTPRKKKKTRVQEVQEGAEEGDSEAESIVSMPVTMEEYQLLVDREEQETDGMQDIRKSLESQREEINSLRAKMLQEYEQLLAARASAVSSESDEIVQLQQELSHLQQHYEAQLSRMQERVRDSDEDKLGDQREDANKVRCEYEAKIASLQAEFECERSGLHEKLKTLESLQQDASQTIQPSVISQSESETKTSESETKTSESETKTSVDVVSVSQTDGQLPESVSDVSSISELRELYDRSRQRIQSLEQELSSKLSEIGELSSQVSDRDTVINTLQREKQDVEEKYLKDLQENEKGYKEEVQGMKEKLSSLSQELEASREQERVLEEQYDELQHQKRQEVEAVRLDMQQERRMEVGNLQSDFKVQLEIELKRQAADLKHDHEEKLREVESELNEKISSLQKELENVVSADGVREEEGKERVPGRKEKLSDMASEKDQDTAGDKDEEEEGEQEEAEVVDSLMSIVQQYSSEGSSEPESPSHASTVRSVPSKSSSMETPETLDQEVKQPEEEGVSKVLSTATDGGHTREVEPVVVEAESASDTHSSPPTSHRGVESLTPLSTPRDPSEDETDASKYSTSPDAVADLLGHISQAKEDAVNILTKEYEEKLSLLNQKLNSLLQEREENRKEIESLKEQLEDAHDTQKKSEAEVRKLQEELQRSMADLKAKDDFDGNKMDEMRKRLSDEYKENVDLVRREYEEKMDLLRQELQESFDEERDVLMQQQTRELQEKEERYDALLESIRNGDSTELADLMRERIDSELEMAKSLMQQEFDETIESEQERLEERHAQEMEDLKLQHKESMALQEQELKLKFDQIIADLHNRHAEQMEQYQAGLVPPSPAKVKVTGEAPEATEVTSSVPDTVGTVSEVALSVDSGRPVSADCTPRTDVSSTSEAPCVTSDSERSTWVKHSGDRAHPESLMVTEGLDAQSLSDLMRKHRAELMILEQRLQEKHKTELSKIEAKHEERLEQLEQQHKKAIQDVQQPSHLTQESGTFELAAIPTFSHDVPKLHLSSLQSEQTSTKSSEDELASLPTRSTPRDMDSERSIDRKEVLQEQLPVPKISPRSEEASDIDHDSLKSEEIPIQSDDSSVEDDTEDGRPAARLDHIAMETDYDGISPGPEVMEANICPLTSAKSEADRISPLVRGDKSLEEESVEGDDELEDLDSEEFANQLGGLTDRSTPSEMLQTRQLADTLANLKPGTDYESSAEFDKDEFAGEKSDEDKDQRIKELESEVADLQQKLAEQIDSEELILMRRDRESEEGQNLVDMLRSDIGRLNGERENLQQTNEKLLSLLSDAVKTYMTVEDSISKKLHKMVPPDDTADQSQLTQMSLSQASLSPFKDSPQRGGAEGGSDGRDGADVAQETSILSNLTDEGLDLSQRIGETMFQGPELDPEGEEILGDASHRLQGSVSRLLDMVEDTTKQLLESRRIQGDLVTSMSSGQQESQTLVSRCQDLEERLQAEVEAKEYLALELHKAEGLIEGYSTEREVLETQIRDLEERKEALVLDLETTRNKLQDLESVHHEATSLRQEIQRQQSLVQDRAGEEAQALSLEVHRVNDEKRALNQQLRSMQEKYESRIRDLESAGEMTEQHYVKVVEDKERQLQDLKLQHDVMEKQLKANRQFLDEQSVEREQEREDFTRETRRLQTKITDLEKQVKTDNRLQREVDDLTEQLENGMNSQSEIALRASRLQQDLVDKQLTTEEMRKIILQLDGEVEDKTRSVASLKELVSKLKEDLSQQQEANEELHQRIRAMEEEEEERVGMQGEEDSTPGVAKKRRRSNQSKLSLQQEEELMHEKEELLQKVEQQMVQISALKNQLDEKRYYTDSAHQEGEVTALKWQVERQADIIENKDKEIDQLKDEVKEFMAHVSDKDSHIQQMSRLMENLSATAAKASPEQEAQIQKILDENAELRIKMRSMKNVDTSVIVSRLNDSLLAEKNQEIDHLNLQNAKLHKELENALSGKELMALREEVEGLKQELEKRQQAEMRFMRASHTSTYSGDGSEVDVPVLSTSMTEKSNLQQEIEESFSVNKMEDTESLTNEILALKMTVAGRDGEIAVLKERLKSKIPKDRQVFYDALRGKEDEIVDLKMRLADKDDLSELEREELKEKEVELKKLQDQSLELEHQLDLEAELQARTERVTALEQQLTALGLAELQNYRDMVTEKDELISSLEHRLRETGSSNMGELEDMIRRQEEELKSLRQQVLSKRDSTPESVASTGTVEILQEKEALIDELTLQIDALNMEIQSLNEFQTKLTEDFDTLQTMLEEKDKEIDTLNQELAEKPMGVEPSTPDAVAALEMEVQNLQKTVTEKDNIIEEKAEELYVLNEKLEQQESVIENLKTSSIDEGETKVKVDMERIIQEKEQIMKEKVEIERMLQEKDEVIKEKVERLAKMEDEMSVLQEHVQIAEKLQKKMEEAGLAGPEIILKEKNETIDRLQQEVQELKEQLAKVRNGGHVEVKEGRAEVNEGIIEKQTVKTEESAGSAKSQSEDDKQAEIEKLRQEVQSLGEKLQEAEQNTYDKVKDKIQEELLREQKESLDKERTELEREKDAQIEELEQEVQALRDRLIQVHQGKGADAEEMEAEVQALRDRVIELNDRESSWAQDREKLDALSLRLKSVDSDAIIIQKNAEIEALRKSLETQKAEMLTDKLDEIAMLEQQVLCEDKGEEILRLNKRVRELEREITLLTEKEKSGSILEKSATSVTDAEMSYADSSDGNAEELQARVLAREDMTETELREAMRQMDKEIVNLQNQVKAAQNLSDSIASEFLELEEIDLGHTGVQTEFDNTEEMVGYLKKKEEAIVTMKDQLAVMRKTLESHGVEIKSLPRPCRSPGKGEASPGAVSHKEEMENLRKEVAFLRSIQDGDTLEEIRERDEEINILREALKAMKGSESDLSALLEDKILTISKLEKQVENLQELGINTENDEIVREKVEEVLAQREEERQVLLDQLKESMENQAELQTKIENQAQEITQLQQQLSEGHEPPADDMMSVKKPEEESILVKLQETQSNLQQTTQELAQTAVALSDSQALMTQIKADMAQKEAQCQTLQAEYVQATSQLSDAISSIQSKEEKLSQTLAQVREREEQIQHLQTEVQMMTSDVENRDKHLLEAEEQIKQENLKLAEEREAEMKNIKERLKEAVEFSEHQLQAVEQKEEENLKLKVELQELTLEKDKEIQSLKEQLEMAVLDREDSVSSLRTTASMAQSQRVKAMKDLEQQIEELKAAKETAGDSGAGDSAAMVTILQRQVEEKEQVINILQRELEIARASLEDVELYKGEDTTLKSREESGYSEGDVPVLRLSRQSDVPRPEGASGDGDHLGDLHPDELRQALSQLKRELDKTTAELEVFRSTASMSAKDYVRKVMELRDELSEQHQQHIQDMQDRARQDVDVTTTQLRIRYEDEMEHLKQVHGKELAARLDKQKTELDTEHKREMARMQAQHMQQMELAQVKEPSAAVANDTAMETVKKLQKEVAKTEKMDRHLLSSLGQTEEDGDVEDSTVSELLFQDEHVPARLKALVNKLHKESVKVLSVSELQFLNRHMSPEKVEQEVNVGTLQAAWDNEKQSLLSAVQSLKDLLAQTHQLRGLDKGSEVTDWRGELLQAVGYVFSKERDQLLAELRTHVVAHPSAGLSEAHRLEDRIRNMDSHQQISLDHLLHADRQSLLAEVRDLRSHINVSQIRHIEERERLSDQLNNMEDQTNKQHRQLQRQVKLLEYKLQQERILQEDMKTSLDAERERTSQLSNKLSHNKMSSLDLQTEVSNLTLQVSQLKDSLEREQNRYSSVTGALEEEKAKAQKLGDKLEDQKATIRELTSDLEETRIRSEVRDKVEATIQKYQADVARERDKRLQAENELEMMKKKNDKLLQDLKSEKTNTNIFKSDYENKIRKLKTSLEMEEGRSADILNALEREREVTAKLRHSLDSDLSRIEDPKTLIKDLRLELDTERTKVHDLELALEREKHRVIGIMAAVDSERTALQDEVEQERSMAQQLNLELEALQLKRLESERLREREQDHSSKLRSECDILRSEIKALKEAENERTRSRDNDRLSEQRRFRQVERERDDIKLKLHEQILENQRLSQKVIDSEEKIFISREKEMKAVHELEHERLQSQLYTRSPVGGSPRRQRPLTSPGRGQEVDPEKWEVYKAQLQSVTQSLQYLMLKYRDMVLSSDRHADIQPDINQLIQELKDIQVPLEFESQGRFNMMSRPSAREVNQRVLQHNSDLTNFVSRLTEEKLELRSALCRLEDEVFRYRQKETEQQSGDREPGSPYLQDRASWASEKLRLQLALNDAQEQLELARSDLRLEKERHHKHPAVNGTESEKIQRLYGKYLRSESFRKALIYQKKYLILLLGGFQDCEQTTLAMLAEMGAYPSMEDVEGHRRSARPLNKFRSGARVVIAVCRMKFLVRKWRRATRVGSPVVAGQVDNQQGYMPTVGSYTPPRVNGVLPRQQDRSSRDRQQPYVVVESQGTFSSSHQPLDLHSPSSSSSHHPVSSFTSDTPPSKEFSSTRHKSGASSTGARRKLIPSTQPDKYGPTASRADSHPDSNDDYLRRLERLQKTLSNMSSPSESPRDRKYSRR